MIPLFKTDKVSMYFCLRFAGVKSKFLVDARCVLRR